MVGAVEEDDPEVELLLVDGGAAGVDMAADPFARCAVVDAAPETIAEPFLRIEVEDTST